MEKQLGGTGKETHECAFVLLNGCSEEKRFYPLLFDTKDTSH
jgi:hypothetical protein